MLTTGIAAVDEAMRRAGVSLGRAYVQGRLYDLGDYPGAVPAHRSPIGAATSGGPPGPGPVDDDAPKVWGHLLRVADPAALFAVLDPYEGFDPGNLGASEFVRALVRAHPAGGGDPLEAQIYWYNFPVTGRPPIASGDYLAHWAAQGKPRRARDPAR